MNAQELPFEETLVETRVVGDQEIVAREVEEAAENGGDRGRVPKLLLAQPRQPRDRLGERDPRIDERLVRVDQLQRPHADCAELADLVACCGQPGRLEVEDDELGVLQQRIGPAFGQRDRGAVADEPAVAGCRIAEQRAGEAVRDRRGGKERASRLNGRERATLLERVHEPVERVERELHS